MSKNMLWEQINEFDEAVVEIKGIRDLLGIISGCADAEKIAKSGVTLDVFDYGYAFMYRKTYEITDRLDRISDNLLKILQTSEQ